MPCICCIGRNPSPPLRTSNFPGEGHVIPFSILINVMAYTHKAESSPPRRRGQLVISLLSSSYPSRRVLPWGRQTPRAMWCLREWNISLWRRRHRGVNKTTQTLLTGMACAFWFVCACVYSVCLSHTQGSLIERIKLCREIQQDRNHCVWPEAGCESRGVCVCVWVSDEIFTSESVYLLYFHLIKIVSQFFVPSLSRSNEVRTHTCKGTEALWKHFFEMRTSKCAFDFRPVRLPSAKRVKNEASSPLGLRAHVKPP